MKARMVLVVTLVLMGVLLAVIPAAAAASTFSASQQFPVVLPVYVPCGNGGAGEDVVLTGYLHDLFVVVYDGNGGFIFQAQDNPMGISGVGLATGTRYQATGLTRNSFTGTVGSQYTYINRFDMVGTGTGYSYFVQETYHVTVNANGTVTAFVDNFSAQCK